MKNKTYIPHGLTALCVLLVLLVCSSWIAGIYGLAVRNPLSSEGLRWMLSHLDENFRTVALGQLTAFVIGGGIAYSSGLFRLIHRYPGQRLIHRPLSLKQKRALLLTLLSGSIYLLLLAVATFSPMGFLMGVTGSLARSPLADHWVPLLSLFLGIIGVVYGIASGQYRTDREVLTGIRSFAGNFCYYLLYLFLMSQFWGIFHYVQWDDCLEWDENTWTLLRSLTYYLPLCVILLSPPLLISKADE